MNTSRNLIFGTAWIFYLAIVFEFLFMITPFALYFYSAYQPALSFLNGSPYTAWLTGFFLPHFSHTDSTLIHWLSRAGWWLAYLGLLLFLVSALQLYLSKLLKKGTVSGLLYRYVRHPQYLALAILGLGTTLIWPRFIVLLTFVLMLFVYRWLAEFEEQNCLQKYGEPYQQYLRKTGRFLPRLGRGVERASEAGKPRNPLTASATYCLVLSLVLSLVLVTGVLLRELSLNSVSALYMDDVAVVSPASMAPEKAAEIYAISTAGQHLQLSGNAGGAPLLVYIVPRDWYLPDLPLDSHETVRERGGHGAPINFDPDHFRVLFTRILTHANQPRGKDILRRAYAFEPLLIVELDVSTGSVTDRYQPPSTVIWGEISPPLL